MKFILSTFVLFAAVSAHANITCKGAVELSLEDAETITRALNQLPVNARMASRWIRRDINNLGNIKAGCRESFDAKEEFCSAMPSIIARREHGIQWNVRGPEKALAKLRAQNKRLSGAVTKICQ